MNRISTMSVPLSYLAVVLIWSTTPLAIQWSAEGVGFLFGVTARMVLALGLCLLLLLLLRRPLPWRDGAWRAYPAAGLGIFGAMTLVYWGAQQIPSGWVSVLFGLTPLLTGLFAALWLGERFTPAKLIGTLLGLAGLTAIFGSGTTLGTDGARGVAALLAAVVIHSLSSVWVKRLNAGVPALAQTAGGLAVAVPLFLLLWWLDGAAWPAELPPRVTGAILYLAVAGSLVGFVSYYYVLRRLSAGSVALITLVTPVLALWLGSRFNGEVLEREVVWGTGLILLGLVLYQWGGLSKRR